MLWVFSALFARPNEKLNDYIEQHSAQWDEIISINSTSNVKQISKITRFNTDTDIKKSFSLTIFSQKIAKIEEKLPQLLRLEEDFWLSIE